MLHQFVASCHACVCAVVVVQKNNVFMNVILHYDTYIKYVVRLFCCIFGENLVKTYPDYNHLIQFCCFKTKRVYSGADNIHCAKVLF